MRDNVKHGCVVSRPAWDIEHPDLGMSKWQLDLHIIRGAFVRSNVSGSSVLKCEAWDFSLFCRSQSFC